MQHPVGQVYLLHFTVPVSDGWPARHYIGWASQLNRRLAHHRSGTGARILAALMKRGGDFTLARTWEGDRTLERKLKKMKMGPRLCPICKQEKATQRDHRTTTGVLRGDDRHRSADRG